MSPAAIDDFLAAPRHAVLSTTRRDGSPQLSVVWYLYRENRFYIVADANAVKCRNIARDARIGLCIDGGFPDFRSVVVYGKAEVKQNLYRSDQCVQLDIFRRYHDTEEQALAYVQEVEQYGECAVIIIHPQRIVGVAMSD